MWLQKGVNLCGACAIAILTTSATRVVAEQGVSGDLLQDRPGSEAAVQHDAGEDVLDRDRLGVSQIEEDDVFQMPSTPASEVGGMDKPDELQTKLRVDSMGLLFGLATSALADTGRTPERMRGKSWLVHSAVILRGHPSGESKGDHWFVTPLMLFRTRNPFPDAYLRPDGGQGAMVAIVAKLYWRDPYYVPTQRLKMPIQTDEHAGDLVPGGFELVVTEINTLMKPTAPIENAQ